MSFFPVCVQSKQAFVFTLNKQKPVLTIKSRGVEQLWCFFGHSH